jgi:hypothetical protein
MTTEFTLPIKRVSKAEAEQGTLVFQPSSRILALARGTSKSIGASCNVYSLDDSIDSIANGHKWAYHVLSYQGAPSIDFSNLRPAESQLGSGGKSSGAVSFMQPFDSIVATMRREEKKNGAGIAYLDYRHPELDQFLSLETRAAYKAVYVPMHDTPEADELLADEQMLTKLAKAYNEFRCFLVKRPLPVVTGFYVDEDGEEVHASTPLFTNLCTEIEIPHRGFCILGAINLSQFHEGNLHMLPSYFRQATRKMLAYMNESLNASANTELSCESPANKQFGLGVFGLASLLGRLGISYREFAEALQQVFDIAGDNANIKELASVTLDSNEGYLVQKLLEAYSEATELAEGKVRAAFCIQPTVSTAQRSFDWEGYHASPEIAPVQGLRHKSAVSTIVKSAIKGDRKIDYHPKTWTMDDVSYSEYALVSSLWQRVLDSTGLAHRHSHCFYGQTFTVDDLRQFYQGDLRYRKSLYYRLPFNVNPQSLDKSKLWQEVQEGELVDFDVDALLNGGNQVFGSIECACTM